MNRPFETICFLILVLLVSAGSGKAQAQTSGDTCTNMPKDFLELADTRGQLKVDIAGLEQSIKELPSKIEQTKTAEGDLRDAEAQLKRLQAAKPVNQQRIDAQEMLKGQIQKYLGGTSSAAFQSELDQKRVELKDKMRQLRCTDKSISGFFSPEQSFKTWMSFAFAFLILLVISGFFVVTYKDPKVRQTVFSAQAGMQFLTLFSLVIAIILFGITAVLHDKELAALLGGLSGDILGRYNVSKGKEEPDLPPPAAGGGAPPQPNLPPAAPGPPLLPAVNN